MMFQLRYRPLVRIALMLVAMHAHSQPPKLERNHEVFPKIATMYQDFAEKKHIPAYAFGIMMDGKLVYSGSSGASLQSMFRIASMTKSFTAMAILKLRDEGKLTLDDPVEWYVPALKDQKFTEDASPITIRHLLTHAAGLPEDNPWGDRQLGMTKMAFADLLNKKISFSNAPNTGFEYSNLGFALLGMIVEKVSGMTYQDYIVKSIWQPLGMKQAAWEFSTIPSQQLMKGYRWLDGAWYEEKPLSDKGFFAAMGGMISSLEALVPYIALYQAAWAPETVNTGKHSKNAPIKASSLREMQQLHQFNQFDTDYHLLDGRACPMVKAYGYGLRWSKDGDKKTYVGHSGGLPGFGSNWLILPEYGVGVIFLANVTYAPAEDINIQVLNTLVAEAQLSPRKQPVSSVLKARQQALLAVLPNWEKTHTAALFADNFFLDRGLEARRKESQDVFKQAGKMIRVNPIIAENQLRGYFVINAEKNDLKIRFTLTPTNPALIQEYHIEVVAHPNLSINNSHAIG